MLRIGSTGTTVEDLQKRLVARGINPGPLDGVFGPKTEAAVKRFQERSGLVVDGIAGPKTMAALDKVASAAVDTPKPGSAAQKPPAAKPAATKPAVGKPKTIR